MAGKRSPKSTRAKTKEDKIVFDQHKEVRAIARERVGVVKPARAMVPKIERKKPKYKKPMGADSE